MYIYWEMMLGSLNTPLIAESPSTPLIGPSLTKSDKSFPSSSGTPSKQIVSYYNLFITQKTHNGPSRFLKTIAPKIMSILSSNFVNWIIKKFTLPPSQRPTCPPCTPAEWRLFIWWRHTSMFAPQPRNNGVELFNWLCDSGFNFFKCRNSKTKPYK